MLLFLSHRGVLPDAYTPVHKNIEVIAGSSMPDEDFGNLILAGHNGNTSVGYFRRLHELSLDDEIIVNYNNKN